VNVAVTADSRIYIEKEEITLPALQGLLEAEKAKHDNATVVLRCDKSQTVELLIQVVDAINKAKLPLVVATEKAQ
jgi:biopolymer transport protein ExbD